MSSYEDEEKFKKVTTDIIKAISKLDYEDIDSKVMKVNIMLNLNHLFNSYEDYNKVIDTLMRDDPIQKQKSLRKELR